MLDPQLFSSGCSPDPNRFSKQSAYMAALQKCRNQESGRRRRESLWSRWITALVLTLLTLLLLLVLAFILPSMPVFFISTSGISVICFLAYTMRAYIGGAFQ